MLVGIHVRFISYTDQNVLVSGFINELGKYMLVEIVNANIRHGCNCIYKSYLMILYHTSSIKYMNVILIPQFIIRLADIEVNEYTVFIFSKPNITNHSV